MSDTYDARQHEQALHEAYRVLAARAHNVKPDQHAHVQPMLDGAFVDVTVWVPRADAVKQVQCPDGVHRWAYKDGHLLSDMKHAGLLRAGTPCQCGELGWFPWHGICLCQGDDPVYHKHYDDQTAHPCARCSECKGFTPRPRPVAAASADS